MARTNTRASSDNTPPSSAASNATSTGRITKSRSELSSSRSHMTRNRTQTLEVASSSGALQNAVDEAQDAVAGSSRNGKGKSRAVEEDSASRSFWTTGGDASYDEHVDVDADNQDDEDVDMQQVLLDSIPANEICPIIDKDVKPFPIMDLPTEIRLEIYRACLTRPYDILLSKRDKPRHKEPEVEVDSDRSGPMLSDSQSDAEETEDDSRATRTPNATAATQSPRRRGLIPTTSGSSRRATLLHGIRSAASRTTRPMRLLSSRSFSGPSTSQTDNDSSPSSHTQSPQARMMARNHQMRAPRAGRSHSSRVRTVSVPANEPPRNQTQDPLLVNILRVSKQVYKEARSVLYNENKFNLDLNTAMSTLSLLHQRSRRQIKHVELEIPTYNEILERFQETVRLSLRYCTGLKTIVIHMPFTLPGADGSGTTGNTTVYANGFDILRWLPQECNIVMKGNICSEIEVVVNKHRHLAKILDKVSREFLQMRPMAQGEYEVFKKSVEEADKENAPPTSTNSSAPL